MKNIFIFFFLCIVYTSIYAQLTNIKWGSEITEGRFDEMIPAGNGDYYGLRTFGNIAVELTNNYTTSISIIRNLEVLKTVELPKEWNGNKIRYEGMTTINKQLLVFYSTKENDQRHILQQLFSDNLTPSPLVLTTSFDLPKKYISENDIYVINAVNNKFAGVFYTVEDYNKKEMSFGYVVLNDSISVVSKGVKTLSIDANQVSFGTHTLGDKGELVLSFNVKYSATRKKIKTSILSNFRLGPFSLLPIGTQYNLEIVDDMDAIKAILIYKCQNSQVTNLSHPLAITTINKYKMCIKPDGNLMLFGTFLRVKNDKIVNRAEMSMNGIFTIQVDLQNSRVTQEKYEDFALNVYTYGLNDRKKNRIENKYAQGKLLPKLYDFKWKNAVILPNGDIVGHLEQTVRNVTYTTYNNGFGYGTGMGGYSPYSNTTANVTYYFKDIIVYCLKADGTVRWMKKIQKSQASSSYDGAYVSCFSFLTNNQYSILFTDNAKNYADNGVFITNKQVHSNPIFAKNNIVSRVSMDLFSGETKREQFLAKPSQEGNYIPRDFKYDNENHTLLLMLNAGTFGGKIRFGSMFLEK